MRASYATVALWATLALIAPSVFETSFAGASEAPEKTVPQGQDPPGADNGEQPIPPQAEDRRLSRRLQSVMRTFTSKPQTLRRAMRRKSSLHLHRR
jgi:hypothetical protein